MNRRSFLNRITLGITAIVVVPKILAEKKRQFRITTAGEIDNEAFKHKFPLTYKECFNAPPYWDELVRRYGKPGSLNEFINILR